MVTTLMNTPWKKGVMPVLVRLLEHNGATYNVIVEVITMETIVQPVDVQLLLASLVKDAYLNAEDGIYRLNHNEENDILFKECLEYGEREKMTKITFKNLADKYDILEEDVERVFACYDTNDMEGMRSQISYCFFCMNSSEPDEFLFDIIRYIKQCQSEVIEDE